MEKISKIIPTNSRVEAVDLSNIKGGRSRLPGVAPTSGQGSERLPNAQLSANDRLAVADLIHPNDDAHRAEIAGRIAENFFKTYNRQAEIPAPNGLEAPPGLPKKSSEAGPIHESEEPEVEIPPEAHSNFQFKPTIGKAGKSEINSEAEKGVDLYA